MIGQTFQHHRIDINESLNYGACDSLYLTVTVFIIISFANDVISLLRCRYNIQSVKNIMKRVMAESYVTCDNVIIHIIWGLANKSRSQVKR